MLPDAHMRAENLAARAELLLRKGQDIIAREAYAEAGVEERTALREVPSHLPRTRGILAVSAVALFYKAGRYLDAADLAEEMLGEDLPSFARWQLADLRAAAVEGIQGCAPPITFDANPRVVRALIEAERLTWGHQHNPSFATEVSLIDPLPHQRIAVYDHLLREPRLRFLLADDAGAGKTIMTGLYLREMLCRRRFRRILIVPPAGLVGNWQRELHTLFALEFRIIRGTDSRKGNPFEGEDSDHLIVSVDTLAGQRMFGRLQEDTVLPYDLVVFDEAHKLSADRDDDLGLRATDRYRLAEALCGVSNPDPRWDLDWACPHVLLLTATPHMGKDFPYYCVWRLLEPQVLTTIDAFEAQSREWRAHRFIRRTKEEMVRYDGTRIYPRRECHTVAYPLTQGALSEQTLYDETTRYIEKYFNLSKILNRGAIRFAMSIFQRRLASSTWAILRSFENRLGRLDALIERVEAGELTIEELNRLADHLDDPFEDRTADEEDTVGGREQNEVEADDLMQAVVTTSLAELQAEREEVERLRDLAQAVYADDQEESKFRKLREWLASPEYHGQKVLIFTEHRDTANFLIARLEAIGEADRIATIHGGMDWKERDEQAASFNRPLAEGGAKWLVATDAAAEGINLQRQCWLMVNYDIPWNPARLEQRMGRIHRYGQDHDPVVILNLVAENTREGRVMITLLDKLEKIRRQLDSDKVFDVVGRVFDGMSIRDLMTTLTSDAAESEAKGRIDGRLTKEQVEALRAREARLYGDGGDVAVHLPRLREERETEALRQLLPGHVAGFLASSAPLLGLRLVGDPDGMFRLDEVVEGAGAPLRALVASVAEEKRGRFTVQRQHAYEAIFVHPGSPVFEHIHASLVHRHEDAPLRGAIFVDPTADEPYLLHVALLSVQRAADTALASLSRPEVLTSRLVAVRQRSDGQCEPASVEHFLLIRPERGVGLPDGLASLPGEGFRLLAQHYLEDVVLEEQVQHERERRLHARADQRDAVVKGFAGLQADLLGRHHRLREKVANGNTKARGPLAQAKQRMRRLDARRRDALGAIDREIELIRPGPVTFLAHAWVLPSFEPRDREAYDDAVEMRAMETVAAYERARGSKVRDVHTPELARAAGLTDWPGFDIEVVRPPVHAGESGERRCVEVKGRSHSGEVELSYNEWAQAATLREAYWLYVVFDCATEHPRLVRVCDPFSRLVHRQVKVRIADTDIMTAADLEP